MSYRLRFSRAPTRSCSRSSIRAGDSGFYFNTGNSVAGAWGSVAQRFPREAKLFAKVAKPEDWFRQSDSAAVEQRAIESLLGRMKQAATEKEQWEALAREKPAAQDPRWLRLVAALASQVEAFDQALAQIKSPRRRAPAPGGGRSQWRLSRSLPEREELSRGDRCLRA